MISGWKRLGVQSRFMILAALGVAIVLATTLSLIAWSEYSALESRLRGLSENELGSLDALVETAMRARVDDKEDVAIKVFNGWFDSRNKAYPGKLWSVWSQKVTAFMAQAYPDRAAKAAVDGVDEEAMRSGPRWRASSPAPIAIACRSFSAGRSPRRRKSARAATASAWGCRTARSSPCSRAASRPPPILPPCARC